MMNNETIKTMTQEFERAHTLVNEFVTAGAWPIVRTAYPNLDGIEDPEAVAQLTALRDRLGSVGHACLYAASMIAGVTDH